VTALDLIRCVEVAGGVLELRPDSQVRVLLPVEVRDDLLPKLKQLKPEMIAMLRRVGGRVAHFPMCPNCGSYALHRTNSIGAYECLTCEKQGIEERDARIASFLADSRTPREGHSTEDATAKATLIQTSGIGGQEGEEQDEQYRGVDEGAGEVFKAFEAEALPPG
jgi:hypothetical protein